MDEDQEKVPESSGPFIIDDDISGKTVHTPTCLGLRVAEGLPKGMTQGMSQIGVPHSSHTEMCWVGRKIVHIVVFDDNCCHLATEDYTDDWLDLFVSGYLFWVFE